MPELCGLQNTNPEHKPSATRRNTAYEQEKEVLIKYLLSVINPKGTESFLESHFSEA